MKRLLPVLLLAACAAQAPAVQAPSREVAARRPVFMFAIDRAGQPTSYLHGSVHLLKDESDGREAVIDEAFERADALVVELDVTRVDQQAMQAMTLQRGLYPEGEDIANHLPPETWQAVLPVLAQLGLAPEGVRRMRPWLLAITLTMLNLQRDGYSPEAGVDNRYLVAAHEPAAPREVIALETAEEQLDAMAGLPDEVQALMLADTVQHLEDDSFLEQMVQAWRNGDVEGLADATFESLREDPRFAPMYESLFFARNRRMAERLAAMLEQPKSYFVVVGAAHLAGPESIPDLLRSRGFRVEQVTVPR